MLSKLLFLSESINPGIVILEYETSDGDYFLYSSQFRLYCVLVALVFLRHPVDDTTLFLLSLANVDHK